MNVGEILNGYEILAPIGEGGAGIVYDVLKDNVHYALKECVELDYESLKRFSRELRIIKTLDTPNIVKVIDDDLTYETPYYIMEKCDLSLERAIKKGLNEDQKYSFFLQACKGFAELHNNGIVHRDIKPSNLLILNDVVKISDFGLGKFEQRDTTTITTEITTKGTPGYMAPEILDEGQFKNADNRSDIFSIGVLLYFIFSDGMMPNPINPNSVPVEILYVVRKCMDAEPAKRYQHVEEIITDINIIINLSDELISMKALVTARKSITPIDFSKRAFILMLKSVDITELINNIRTLTIEKLRYIANITPEYVQVLSKRIMDLCSEEEGQYGLQFSDVDLIVFACESLIYYDKDNQSVQELLGVSLSLSVNYNRWDCMRAFVRMVNSLDDDEVRYLTIFFVEHRDKMKVIQDSIDTKFNHVITGLIS